MERNEEFNFIGDLLFVEHIKYHRAKTFNSKRLSQYWRCANRKWNCKAHATSQYKVIGQEDVSQEERATPWAFPTKFKHVLLEASSLDDHATCHHVSSFGDLPDLFMETMNRKIIEDTSLEPTQLYKDTRDDFANKVPACQRSELVNLLSEKMPLRNASRRLRESRERLIGAAPKDQDSFDPTLLPLMQNGEPLLSRSTTTNGKKTITFTSNYMLRKLVTSTDISVDGTFYIAPVLWKQVFILMINTGGVSLPVAYGLLPSKEIESYRTFFRHLKNIAQEELGCTLWGASSFGENIKVRTDFEINIHKAVRLEIGEDTEVERCYFHFSNCIWRRVQAYRMVHRYVSNDKVRQFVRSLVSLAQCPPSRLREAFELINENFVFDEPELVKFKRRMMSYVYDQWLNKEDFKVKLWNCWTRTGNNTNNDNEAYNRTLKRIFKAPHPNPNYFARVVQSQLVRSENSLREVEGGGRPELQRKRYRVQQTNKDRLKKCFEEGTTSLMDFLLSMGSNCLENDIVEGEAEKEAENDPIFPIEAEDTDSLQVFLNFPDFNQEDEVLNIPEDLEAETETPQSRPKKRRMQSRNPVRNGRTLCPVDNKGFTRASNSLTCKDCYTKFHVKCIRFQYSEEDFLCEECQSVLSPDTGYDGSPSPVTPAGSRPSLERYWLYHPLIISKSLRPVQGPQLMCSWLHRLTTQGPSLQLMKAFQTLKITGIQTC